MENKDFFNIKNENKFKIIIAGDANVGKSSLFWRFTQNYFFIQKDQVTSIDFKIKKIEIDNTPIKLYIWDTAGQQKFRSIVKSYFVNCQGVLLIFDLSDKKSFLNIERQWVKICLQKCNNNTQYVLVGNKSDLQKTVQQQQILQYAKNKNIQYFETSSKLDKGISQPFYHLAKKIFSKKKKYQQVQPNTQNKTFLTKNSMSIQKIQNKKNCC